jgi:membrane protein DedA with SNARE-associated domain
MLEDFVINYGYIAVLIGTALEGEIILAIAGFVAYLGLLNVYGVLIAGFFGSLIGDQIFFFLGRTRGKGFLEKRPRWQKKAEWVHDLLHRHKIWLMLGFRFFYGFRIITPFALGTSEISTKQFVLFNTLGAFVWSLLFGIGGYIFGGTLEIFIHDLKRYEFGMALGIIALVGVIWSAILLEKCFARRHRRNKKR